MKKQFFNLLLVAAFAIGPIAIGCSSQKKTATSGSDSSAKMKDTTARMSTPASSTRDTAKRDTMKRDTSKH